MAAIAQRILKHGPADRKCWTSARKWTACVKSMEVLSAFWSVHPGNAVRWLWFQVEVPLYIAKDFLSQCSERYSQSNVVASFRKIKCSCSDSLTDVLRVSYVRATILVADQFHLVLRYTCSDFLVDGLWLKLFSLSATMVPTLWLDNLQYGTNANIYQSWLQVANSCIFSVSVTGVD